MALSDELLQIRLELKGVREAVQGFKSVDKAQAGVSTSTTKAGMAATSAERRTSGLTRAYQRLGGAARWGLGFLGVGGVFALKAAVDNSEELAKTTAGLTRNLDLQTNVASRWGAVAHARDIDSKALGTTFAILSSKMVDAAREGGTALTPFHQLGLEQEDVAKGARNFQFGLMQVAEALGDAEGGAKRMTAAKALLGKGYASVLPLFSEGTKGLKEQLHWADKYGVTLDTKTNDALMDSVMAQRESKMAMLGLQLTLSRGLLPAIEAGHGELQQFIATLNDPDLSADQKIARIERQFGRIEDTLIDLLIEALPAIAEHGGELGVKLAGAVWQGFWESDSLGKFVIGGWLFMAMGGGGMIRTVGSKAGGMVLIAMATGMGNRFPILTIMMQDAFSKMGKLSGRAFAIGVIAGIVLLGFFIAEEVDKKTDGAFRQWGINAGENFVNALIWAVNQGIGAINDVLDEANVLGKLGVDAPNIGEVGEVDFGAPEGRKSPFGIPTPDYKNPGNPFGIGKPRGGRSGQRLPRASFGRPQFDTPSLPHTEYMAGGRRRSGKVVLQIPLDGKVIAERTVDLAELEAALR